MKVLVSTESVEMHVEVDAEGGGDGLALLLCSRDAVGLDDAP